MSSSESSRDALLIRRGGHFVLEQAYSWRLPGYLVLDARREAARLGDLEPAARSEMVDMLVLAEQVVERLLAPGRVFLLRFGNEVARLHFHVVPRTERVLAAYAAESGDQEPWSGGALVDWIWRRHEVLGHTEEDVLRFAREARALAAELAP